MSTIPQIIDCLEQTPIVLTHLLSEIPQEHIQERRITDQWSIHEQISHLVDAQQILIDRFMQFRTEENPLIKSYEPLANKPEDYYQKFNLSAALEKFPVVRGEMVKMLRGFENEYWNLSGRHEVFSPYGTRLLLIHSLNVDYAHLFSIEQLGLTKPGLEEKITVF